MSYDPHSKLDSYKESMICLARNGLLFREYAVREILRGTSSHLCYDLRVNMILSALIRQDDDAVRVYVNDWSSMGNRKPSQPIFKWNPGDHYYALDQKFNTLEEARRHLDRHGYDCGPVVEKYVYAEDGG